MWSSVVHMVHIVHYCAELDRALHYCAQCFVHNATVHSIILYNAIMHSLYCAKRDCAQHYCAECFVHNAIVHKAILH